MPEVEGSVSPVAHAPWIWRFCFNKLRWYSLAALPVATPVMEVESVQLLLYEGAKMAFKKRAFVVPNLRRLDLRL